MKRNYILTGGTGFLGAKLAQRLIKEDDNVIFLGRKKEDITLHDRIGRLGQEDVYEVVLDSPEFLPKNLFDKVKRADGIWHLAANLSFRTRDAETVMVQNTQMLKNSIMLAEHYKCPLYFVSTAYVHGKRSGMVYENDLVEPKRFNNAYEKSKFTCERMLHRWSETSLDHKYIIFRPSILIDSVTSGKTSFGYYGVLSSFEKLVDNIKKFIDKKPLLSKFFGLRYVDSTKKVHIPFFPVAKKCCLNMISADDVVDWMIDIVGSEKSLRKTFHLVNPKPLSMKTISQGTLDAVGIDTKVIDSIPLGIMRISSRIIQYIGMKICILKPLAKTLKYYGYYMLEYNAYDMSNTRSIIGDKVDLVSKEDANFISNLALSFIASNNENKIKTNH